MIFSTKNQVIIITIENHTACPTIHKEITLNIEYSILYKSPRTTDKNFLQQKNLHLFTSVSE